jgi:hypothetical protein
MLARRARVSVSLIRNMRQLRLNKNLSRNQQTCSTLDAVLSRISSINGLRSNEQFRLPGLRLGQISAAWRISASRSNDHSSFSVSSHTSVTLMRGAGPKSLSEILRSVMVSCTADVGKIKASCGGQIYWNRKPRWFAEQLSHGAIYTSFEGWA